MQDQTEIMQENNGSPEELRQILLSCGISVSEEIADKLYRYYELIRSEGEITNLTRITEFREVVLKHFADSLAPFFEANGKKIGTPDEVNINCWNTMLDVGSGAGIPSIPIAICFPEKEVYSLETRGKKTAFQNMCREELDLHNFRVLYGRAEDFARQSEYRDGFDLVTARAVAALPLLSEYCLPFTRVGGLFLSYKSGDYQEELEAAKRAIDLLGGKLEDVMEYRVDSAERTMIRIRKTRPTPSEYPRKAGIPAKRPL